VLFLQWHIASSYLGSVVELVIRAAKVSILLTEEKLLFTYFIEMKYYVIFLPNRWYVKIYVLDVLSSFEYVEIIANDAIANWNACKVWFELWFKCLTACCDWDLDYVLMPAAVGILIIQVII